MKNSSIDEFEEFTNKAIWPWTFLCGKFFDYCSGCLLIVDIFKLRISFYISFSNLCLCKNLFQIGFLIWHTVIQEIVTSFSFYNPFLFLLRLVVMLPLSLLILVIWAFSDLVQRFVNFVAHFKKVTFGCVDFSGLIFFPLFHWFTL